MKVLVACEFSGRVRDAFIQRGHDAISCDLLPSETPGPHIQGDFRDNLKGWDLIIGHPPCTYLCNSGVRWLLNKDGSPNEDRLVELTGARNLFYDLRNADCNKICIENPIPHKYARLPKYTQKIQPWQFGNYETKATCLWLKNLPPLIPTAGFKDRRFVKERKQRVFMESPGPNRWKNRSRTYLGIAEAMAEQWGCLACEAEI